MNSDRYTTFSFICNHYDELYEHCMNVRRLSTVQSFVEKKENEMERKVEIRAFPGCCQLQGPVTLVASSAKNPTPGGSRRGAAAAGPL